LLSIEVVQFDPSVEYWSFNPCFRGTCSRSGLLELCGECGFVSILVFVELALDPPCTVIVEPAGQVSILVFVELALDPGCLLGLALHTLVSILVFVELALDQQYHVSPLLW